MANPFFGSPQGGGARFQAMSDLAAAERQVETYFSQLMGQAKVPPEGAVPFGLNSQQAIDAYTKWLNGLAMAPGDLKKTADLGALKAVFLPFWVVNAMTYTTYHGQRGLNYHETETTRDAQGNPQTRQVTKTRWSPANGEVTHYFENLLIPAKDLPAAHVTLLTPPEVIGKMEHYAADQHREAVEPYAIDPRTAFTKARTTMEVEAKKLCAANMGGDQQKVDSAQTKYVGVSVRHVLVPCYHGTYKYKDKNYDVLINGFNGQVTGDSPVSAGKVLLIVGVIVLVLAIIIALVYFFVIAPMNKKSELPEKERPAVVRVLPAEGGVNGGQSGDEMTLRR